MLKVLFSSPRKRSVEVPVPKAASGSSEPTTPVPKLSSASSVSSLVECVALKVALVGDAQAGKTSLARRFQEDRFAEEYHPTFAVNVLERRIRLGGDRDVVFSLWDVGGKVQVDEMLPMACVDATVIAFVFDLTRLESLENVKEMYRKVRWAVRPGAD
jgi:GTPase SAR1 family protein